MKKYLVLLIASSLLFSCTSNDTSKGIVIEDQDDTFPIESNPDVEETFDEEQSHTSLLDEIPSTFISYKTSKPLVTNELNDQVEAAYVKLDEGHFEAKKFSLDGNEYIAINNIIDEDLCSTYESFLLTKNEQGVYENVFNEFYPKLSLYSFYSFEDIQVQQLEGDEQTRFAGYHFDLSKKDQIGIQFMFCNENDAENTQWLNANSKYIYQYID